MNFHLYTQSDRYLKGKVCVDENRFVLKKFFKNKIFQNLICKFEICLEGKNKFVSFRVVSPYKVVNFATTSDYNT